MYTSDIEKLEPLYERLSKNYSQEIVDEVRNSIEIDPHNAVGCAITKKGYAHKWHSCGVMDIIMEHSRELGIKWTQTSERD